MEEELRRYCSERGISDDTIEIMEKDKLDIAVIAAMPDSDLSKYFVVGDRVAVKEFCKRKSRPQVHRTGDRKEALLSKLRAKLDARKRSSEHHIEAGDECDEGKLHVTNHRQSLYGNNNGMKSSRRIEIGWLHGDTLMNVKQVRTRNGGGTRIVSTSKLATKRDLMETAKSLFFSNGNCKYGNDREFNFDMCDFKQSIMSDTVTVADLHEQNKMSNGKVRVYLCTTRRATATVTRASVEEDVSEDDFNSVDTATGENACTFADLGTPTVSLRMQKQTPLFVNHQQVGANNSSARPSPQLAGASSHILHEDALSSCSNNVTVEMYCSSDNSEDEHTGVQLAIENSLDYSQPELSDWKSQLAALQRQIITQESTVFNVTRCDVLNGFRRGVNRKCFDPFKRIDVLFVDSANVAEGSIDSGGPTREFLRLLLLEIFTSGLFEGPANGKQLALSTIGLEKRLYVDAGKGIAVALLHGGSAPMCISTLCYDVLMGTPDIDVNPAVHMDEICNVDVKSALQKIQLSTSLSDGNDAIEEAADLLTVLGSLRPVRSLDERDALVRSALSFYLVGRLTAAYTQLREGLETGGLFRCMQRNQGEWRAAFTHVGYTEMTLSNIATLFQPSLSPQGSAKRPDEARILAYWRDWLLDLPEADSRIGAKDILVFATGADREPPLGFPLVPTLSFNHSVSANMKKYPTANTCVLVLTLPVVRSYEEFCEVMSDGIIQSPAFGKH